MITGIILAGGESRRFGGEKGLALLQGRPLYQWCAAVFEGFCEETILSANSASYADTPYRVIPDLSPGHGPMMGIYSALLASNTEHNLVLSVDTPLVPVELMRFIFDSRGDAHVALPQSGDRHYEPLIGYYNRAVLPAMKAFMELNNYKLPDFFQTIPFRGIDLLSFPGYSSHMLTNINTRGDLDGI
jgi:molybdopterin-guanine dinucleotide biosynthesis protein A